MSRRCGNRVNVLFFSFPMSNNTYVAFFIDWIVQAFGSGAYMLAIFICAMYYIGMCFYINTMIDDLKTDMVDLDKNLRIKLGRRYDPLNNNSNQHALAMGIRFHNEIIEQVYLISINLCIIPLISSHSNNLFLSLPQISIHCVHLLLSQFSQTHL